MSMSPITPSGAGFGVVPGHIVSTSANMKAALLMIMAYLNSTYALQAADTQLEAAITNEEAKEVQDFQKRMNAADQNSPNHDNYIRQMEELDPNADKNYSTDMQKLVQYYTNANADNQAKIKIMDGNNSTAQNILSQNAQGQQGVIQTMGSINSIASNLARIVQG